MEDKVTPNTANMVSTRSRIIKSFVRLYCRMSCRYILHSSEQTALQTLQFKEYDHP